MSPPTASPLVTVGITGLAALLLAGWVALAWTQSAGDPRRAARVAAFGAGIGGWAALTFALAASGVLAETARRPPPFAIVPLGLVVGVAVVARSRIGAALASAPLWLLVAMQGFRLPLELVMHRAALDGTMPPQMTFGVVAGHAGCNYDIITGISALVLGAALHRTRVPRRIVLAWNVLGSALLLAIVAVAIVSTPVFAAFGRDPSRLNTWVLFAPWVWLPAVLVGSALLGHVLVFRALRNRTGEVSSTHVP